MKSFMVAALVGVVSTTLAVQIDTQENKDGAVWNGDISGFKKGDYTSLPEIA